MALFAGCANGDGATVGLYLSVSAAPADNAEQFQRLRVVLVQGDIVWPPAGAADGQIPLGERDLRVKPVLLQLATDGATFSSGGVVQTRVTGETDDGAIIALWEGAVDLGAQRTYEVELRPLTQACDVDGDGFVDCTVAGCCASGTSPFEDCVPDDPTANPLAIEPACEPCDDVVDQHCDGQDTPCIDGDLDGVS